MSPIMSPIISSCYLGHFPLKPIFFCLFRQLLSAFLNIWSSQSDGHPAFQYLHQKEMLQFVHIINAFGIIPDKLLQSPYQRRLKCCYTAILITTYEYPMQLFLLSASIVLCYRYTNSLINPAL